ncbi:choice-of-anchor D domain-containing protein [Kitasatospora griseola]|uniref:choice-of-anchor D domain-containing protein n=1 Tax=Kitasatospora griseola TaxID=2064 RepID=UPI0037F22027
MTQTVIAHESTVAMNPMRTGWDQHQPKLAPSHVSAADFGQLFKTAVDGQVYAQPLVIGSTVVVATENNMVYGIHAVTGAVLWSRSLGPAWPSSAISCGNIDPNIGVTATPVYDTSSGRVYLTAKVDDGPDTKHPHWYLHSLDVATGHEAPGWPVTIQGSPVNDPGTTFSPYTALQRPGLLLLDGEVFAGFGSHCDHTPYVGYVVGVKTATGALRMWAADTVDGLPSDDQKLAGIWMGGGGLVSDGPGRIFFSTGNGVSPAPGPGKQPPTHLAESVVHLSSSGQLTAVDFFSPHDADQLDQSDNDFGSGGPVALPSPPFGAAAHPKLLVHIGKDGRVFLLDRDDLGGRDQGPNKSDKALSVAGPFSGIWGSPAVWGGDGGYVYVPENGGKLRALKFGVDGTGTPVLTNAGISSAPLGAYPGSPTVTSDGTTSGSALVWIVCAEGPDQNNAQLRAYDAVPVNGVLKLRWSAPIGTAVKFSKVAVGEGRVYVGTSGGHLVAFGSPSQAALTGSPVDLGQVAVGATGNATATVTATRSVTVTAITTTAPFSVTPPALPVTLSTGGTLAVPVGFAPTEPGGTTATLSFAVTANGAADTIGFDLHGTGTRPGFAASPPSLDFGELATQSSVTLGVAITNTGTASETIVGATPPSPPFTATNLPAVGSTLAPGASLPVSVVYAPTAPSPAGGYSSQVVVTGADGLSVTVPLTGTAVVGSPHLTIKPTSLDFGEVPVGGSLGQTFTIKNSGTVTLVINKAARPAAPFTVRNPVAEGQQLGPDQVVPQTVVFSPTATGPASGQFVLTGNDGQGQQPVSFTGTGVTSGSVAQPNAGGWTFNGTAMISDDDILLTDTTNGQTGSALYNMVVPSANLHAHFTAVIGGGSGADGLAFVLLDAAHETPHSLGEGGGGLGYSGLHGLAVTLDTSQNANDPSANFVGLATGGNGDALTYAATATNIGDLRTGTHTVDVQVTGGRVQVTVDGKPTIDATVAVPATVLVGFTGATGGLNDNHRVQGVSITF